MVFLLRCGSEVLVHRLNFNAGVMQLWGIPFKPSPSAPMTHIWMAWPSPGVVSDRKYRPYSQRDTCVVLQKAKNILSIRQIISSRCYEVEGVCFVLVCIQRRLGQLYFGVLSGMCWCDFVVYTLLIKAWNRKEEMVSNWEKERDNNSFSVGCTIPSLAQ